MFPESVSDDSFVRVWALPKDPSNKMPGNIDKIHYHIVKTLHSIVNTKLTQPCNCIFKFRKTYWRY